MKHDESLIFSKMFPASMSAPVSTLPWSLSSQSHLHISYLCSSWRGASRKTGKYISQRHRTLERGAPWPLKFCQKTYFYPLQFYLYAMTWSLHHLVSYHISTVPREGLLWENKRKLNKLPTHLILTTPWKTKLFIHY